MIQISEHFTYKKLLRLTLPSIVMLVFTSIYGVVDGFFVSNFVGDTPFAAVNFIMPFLMILGSLGFMFGTGGGALIAKTLGEGDKDKANRLFSLTVYSSIVFGVIFMVIGFIFIRPFAALLGAEGELLENSVIYGRIILAAIPVYILQYEFQALCATAEKHTLGLIVTVIAGCANIVLDALFVAVFNFGLEGAAAATAISQCIGGLIPLIYFSRKNNSLLKLGKTNVDFKTLGKICANGSSELLSNVSMSVVSMLYNSQLLEYAGQNGVSAYGVLMYVGMIFQAIFIGYSVGSSPVVSYNYGTQNKEELKSLRKKGFVLISSCSVLMLIAALLLSRPLSILFVGYNEELLELTARAFLFFSFSFLFSGFAIFGSSFFTALNDGFVSAAISFLRTLVFQIGAVLIFPLIWQLDGIWISIVAAEIMAVVVTVIFFIVKRKKYGY